MAMEILFVLLSVVLYAEKNTAQNTPSCPWKAGAECLGPFRIRRSRPPSGDPTPCVLQPSQNEDMLQCLQQCQADHCCRAFGLNSTGLCVSSNLPDESYHFVKESPYPLNISCFADFCNSNRCGKCKIANEAPTCQPQSVTNGVVAPGDEWGALDTCPDGSYAAGMELKISDGIVEYGSFLNPDVTSSVGDVTDHTAVNAIRLFCRDLLSMQDTGTISSEEMTLGTFRSPLQCPLNFWIVDYQLSVCPKQEQPRFVDNKGVCGVRIECRGPGMAGTESNILEEVLQLEFCEWGNWTGGCDSNNAICSLKTRVQPKQGDSSWWGQIDDLALTDAQMTCCK